MALNNILDQMDLTDVFRTFHPIIPEYTFFLSAHRKFSKIDHILGHKSGLNWSKEIEIIQYIVSDHTAMKLKVNHMKKSGKTTIHGS